MRIVTNIMYDISKININDAFWLVQYNWDNTIRTLTTITQT